MLKLIGAIMIFASFGGIGIQKSENMRARRDNILRILTGLNLLENEISYGKRDIKTSMESIAEAEGISIFERAADYMEIMSASRALCEAVDKQEMNLTKQECGILKSFAENLGTTGSKTQLETIEYAKKRLEHCANKASEDYENKGKLCRGIGFLSGVLAVILLF